MRLRRRLSLLLLLLVMLVLLLMDMMQVVVMLVVLHMQATSVHQRRVVVIYRSRLRRGFDMLWMRLTCLNLLRLLGLCTFWALLRIILRLLLMTLIDHRLEFCQAWPRLQNM